MFNTMYYETEPDGPFLYKLGAWEILNNVWKDTF